MAPATSVHDLRTLIRSCHPLIVIETVEEERVPLSVPRHEDIDQLRETAQGRFVNVR